MIQGLKQNKYIMSVIKALHLNKKSFKKNLAQGEYYEFILNEWATNLFDEGKTVKEAVNTIIERRRLLMIHNAQTYEFDNFHEPDYKKIIQQLKVNSVYTSLNEVEQQRIQKRVLAFIKTRLYNAHSIVELILKIIENTMQSTPVTPSKNNKKDFFHCKLSRDINFVSKQDYLTNITIFSN